MDKEILHLLASSVSSWSADNQRLLHDIESTEFDNSAHSTLFNELNQLGFLTLLGEEETHHDVQAVAVLAYELARFSASAATMLVQQNLAAWLLAETKQPMPSAWLALPLFDALVEWPYQGLVATGQGNITLNGQWQSLPLLPIAAAVLLPLIRDDDEHFALAYLPRDSKGLKLSSLIPMLGLRGCPQGDLKAQEFVVNVEQIIGQGAELLNKIKALWSQAEVCMLAIRAAIAASSYQTALDYAKERYQGGKIIIEHSLIRKMLADFYREQATMDEVWRSLAQGLTPYQALSAGQQGLAINGGEKLPWLTSDGIQILGGVGYMEDYPQERRYRDAKQCEFLLGHPQARTFAMWEAI